MALLNEAFDHLSQFYENDNTVIYKGKRMRDGKRVILKSHKHQSDMHRIKHEYDLLSGKEITGAAGVLDISYNDDRNYLVLEDAGGVVLDDYIQTHKPDPGTLLLIAESAAQALASIHDQDIVHCDIKPANMLVHPDTLQVWFIDFGISFTSHVRNARAEGFAGTLEYMAPEQTGRLDMTVDIRSDLYSLGITYYWMLTGCLPFSGDSAVELIHAQTVLPAVPISERVQVDPTLESIVQKLMEKSPKRRYQSAWSLTYDLSLCRRSLAREGRITPFIPGERDVFASLEPGQKLFGKEHLLEEMLRVYHSTPSGRSSLILLHGPDGVGKSSLLRHFEEYVEQSSGYLLKGSFDWREGEETFSAIREIFDGFELYAYNNNLPLPEYRARILEALGNNAQVLIDILPSFQTIMGPQPPVLRLPPRESLERARQVFRKTLAVLCDAPYPYVLVFENFEYADESSIGLLLDAAGSEELGNCIMVLSYSDDDPAFLQRFLPQVQALSRGTLQIADIGVTHMSREAIGAFVADFFDQDTLESRQLADIVYQATGGVLSEVRGYLQALYRARQVRYDPEGENWIIQVENLDQHIQLDLEKQYSLAFDRLEEAQRLLLRRCACIGETFGLEDAAHILGLGPQELEAHLLSLEDWLIRDTRNVRQLSFANRSVFQLCYGRTPREERDGIHREIVDTLYQRYRGDEEQMLRHSTLFTRQILSSDRSLYSRELLLEVARSKLTAAGRIMEASNLVQAARTFENGLRLMGEEPFTFDFDLAFEFHLQYAMCRFAQHESDRAEQLVELILHHADREADRYRAYYMVVSQYFATAEWERAKHYCKRYLGEAGQLLPDGQDIGEAGEREYDRFYALTGEEGVMVCVDFGRTGDPLVEHHGNILSYLSAALLFSLEEEKCKYYLYKTINHAVDHREVFTDFALIFCVGAARYASIHNYSWAKYLIETGLEYAERHGTGQAFLWGVYGNMISHWVNPLSETLEIYKKAKYHSAMEGNAFFDAFADMMLLNHHSFVGENLREYLREAEATLNSLKRSRLSALQVNFTTFRQYARCLLGRTESPGSFDDPGFREADLEALRGSWNGDYNDNFLFVYRLRALYIHGYYQEALTYAHRYLKLNKRINLGAYITHVQFYYYYSLTLLELCRMHPGECGGYREIVENNLHYLKLFATVNPDNFALKHRMIAAGLRSLDSSDIGLVEEYAEAHRGFQEQGLLWDMIFIERQMAVFWERRGVLQYPPIHRRNALELLEKIGARHLVEAESEGDSALPSRTVGTVHLETSRYRTRYMDQTAQTQYTGINAALDFQALLGVLESLIALDTLPALAGEFLRLLLRNGNADKALLFLEDGMGVSLCAVEYAVDGHGYFNQSELPLDMKVIADDLMPKKLIELVLAKEEAIHANSARNEYRMTGDVYLNRTQPESFLCMPVEAKGRLLGAVYLENASLAGSFPEGRIRFLQSIVMQTSVMILGLQNVSRMAEYTRDLERRLSSYLNQQNALIAGIAHEINSPVGVCVTVATKLLEKTGEVTRMLAEKGLSKSALSRFLEEAQSGLDIITNNTMRAGELVQNFKKMSVEQSNEVFEELELAPTLRNIVDYVRPGVKRKLSDVTIQAPEGLRIYSSSGVLAQIFTNLIMNSAIHGFEGMEKDQCRATIQVTELEGRDEIEIRYTDNGRGMPAEVRDKVFQPFFTTKRNRGGSGLGGHIVLSLVTQTLGGSIACISEPEEGTTFVIRLPKHKPKEVSAS